MRDQPNNYLVGVLDSGLLLPNISSGLSARGSALAGIARRQEERARVRKHEKARERERERERTRETDVCFHVYIYIYVYDIHVYVYVYVYVYVGMYVQLTCPRPPLAPPC